MARENRFIVNKFGQKHSYDNLVTIMQDLTPQEVKSVLITLGLDGVIDDGGLAPAYSADIVSSEERFLNPNISHNITLTGKLYNYYQDASDKATSWKWTRDSDSPDTDAQWVKTTREITLTDADLTNKIQSQKVFFHLEVKIEEEIFTDVIDFSTVVTLNSVQIQQSHGLFIGGDPAEITLTADVGNISAASYKWYVNDELKTTTRIYKLPSSIVPNGKVANVRLEVVDVKGNTHSDFVSIPKLTNGTVGEPGVPGPPGQDGTPKYTWIKYADDNQGTDMSEYPTKPDGTFREWMGVGANKDTPAESNQYTDYIWSKYIGEDGVPGENGYMWIVYSQFPKGLNHLNKVDVHNDPYDEVAEEYMVYLGLAYNKPEKTEPNFNAMTPAVFEQQEFYWSKIKGEDGHTGYVLDSDNDIIALPADSEGTVIGTPTGNRSVFSLFYGNTQINLSQMYAEFTQTGGVVFTSSRGNTTTSSTDWIEVSSLTADTGTVTLTVYADSGANKVVAKTTVQVAKFKNTPVFNIVTSVSSINVVPGVGTAPEVVAPTTLEVKVMKNTGYEVIETSEGTLTYKYNYQTGDGQPLEPDASGKYTIPVSNAGNPKHIEIQYFHPIVSNKIADRETVPFVRDGKNGDPGTPGQPGDPGQNGAPGVPGSRGPMARMIEWREGYTYYRNAEYRDYIYYRSDNTTYEGWYCVREVATNLYDTTVDGVKQYKAVANTGSPDTAIFQKQDFVDSQVFGTIIAENANLAGFIFRNEKMFSQAMRTNGTPKVTLDGKNGLIDAFGAILENSTFTTGSTGQRIEIKSDRNAMEFYINGKTSPAISIDTGTGGGGNPAEENPVIQATGKTTGGSTGTSFMSNSGVFANGSNMYFWDSSSGGPINSASVVGLYQKDDTEDPTDFQGSIRAAVVGRNQFMKNEGRTFGGYFDSTLVGGTYMQSVHMPTGGQTYQGRVDISTYINMANSGVVTLMLPLMSNKNTGNWNKFNSVGFWIDVVMYNDATDTRIVSQNGSQSIYRGRNGAPVGEITLLNSGMMRLYWNGLQWFPFLINNF